MDRMAFDYRTTAIGRVGMAERAGALTGLHFGDFSIPPGYRMSDSVLLDEAFRQFEAWLAGEILVFSLPLAPEGTAFVQRVWAALQDIPYGQTRTYRDISIGLGSPDASRAVGAACARNPLPIFIPCHRVVRSDGKIGGYLGGSVLKSRLLGIERANSA